ncbi:protein of unknown function [Nitrospira japonica]|uniref:Uncharacterized protein n=1 Tax=Nitrospira japonica TaxID=1325564 RepID=A0A1W1I1Q8_9BACT|nr:protein of unknown function [Nitrospira japonica]
MIPQKSGAESATDGWNLKFILFRHLNFDSEGPVACIRATGPPCLALVWPIVSRDLIDFRPPRQ